MRAGRRAPVGDPVEAAQGQARADPVDAGEQGVARGDGGPGRHARTLVAWCDGVLFHSVAGAGSASPPPEAESRAGAAGLLRGDAGRRLRRLGRLMRRRCQRPPPSWRP
ncbi:hypothetical protein [Actinacidiphila glaucinigra]|uniref:hypothetical protein n=1 Tax=Actinacidiphila glaucinigra TaxID=235986 RepID=UPI00386A9869